jgi:hypothetical protein
MASQQSVDSPCSLEDCTTMAHSEQQGSLQYATAIAQETVKHFKGMLEKHYTPAKRIWKHQKSVSLG